MNYELMLRLSFLICWLSAYSSACAQHADAAIVHRLFLIGDTGEEKITKTTMGDVIRRHIGDSASATTVLFLGDNIYPAGLSNRGSRTFPDEQEILAEQVSWVAGSGAAAIFIPGNHDWEHWGKKGHQYAKNQQSWFDSLENPLLRYFPRENCPGPVEINVFGQNSLVILNSQWFLHEWEKPGPESGCPSKTAGEAFRRLEEMLNRSNGQRVIIAAHHPLVTYGSHGGVFSLRDHLFPLTALQRCLYIPLPLIGSLYPLYRKLFPHTQDTGHPSYRAFSEPILALLKRNPGNIYVSGHEHALQYIVRDSTHLIVSGAGAKSDPVKTKRHGRFSAGKTGFVQLDLLRDGSVFMRIMRVDRKNRDGREIFTAKIPAKGTRNNDHHR